ncbi:MAG: CRTAC1 family protein [Saprospiraceae bacterium]|nr:CRTAC1 family protein [Saprospiraceae bacterium]
MDKIGVILALLFLTVCQQSCKKDVLFSKLSSTDTGVKFSNTIIEDDTCNIIQNIYTYNGSGVAVGDLNGDGFPEIFFGANQQDNALYLNKSGLKFEEITKISGVSKKLGEWTMGVCFIDINEDEKLDIFVCNSFWKDSSRRRNQLFINQGNNAEGIPLFVNLANEYGLDGDLYSDHAQFYDFDNDGDLDVFLAINSSDRRFENTFILPEQVSWQPNRDRLFENKFDSLLQHPVFYDVSDEKGIKLGGFTNGSAILDFNLDGFKDIYVANDFLSCDLLYLSQDNITYENGVRQAVSHQSFSSMGMDIGDLNNDLLPDFIVTEMLPSNNTRKKTFLNGNNYTYNINTEKFDYEYQYLRNTVQINQGMGPEGVYQFSDLSFLTGMDATDWSWAPLIADFDADGNNDVFITNGFVRDINDHDWINFKSSILAGNLSRLELTKTIPQVKIPNFMFRNKGLLHFENVSKAWNIDDAGFSNGAVYCDLDLDGDLDLITNNINDEAGIYQNSLFNGNHDRSVHFVKVKLSDFKGNRKGLGAELYLFAGKHCQYTSIMSTRGYLSGPESEAYFGIGKLTEVDSIIIDWGGGEILKYENISIDSCNLLLRENGVKTNYPVRCQKLLRTSDQSIQSLAYPKMSGSSNDFAIQKTLPYQLHSQSPHIEVADLDQDGLDDLVLANLPIESCSIYFQEQTGTFVQKKLFEQKISGESKFISSSRIFDADGDGKADIYLSCGHYTSEQGEGDLLLLNRGDRKFITAQVLTNGKRILSSLCREQNLNGDNMPELFVANRVNAGSYPEGGEHHLLYFEKIENGTIQYFDSTMLIKDLNPQLQITDACWADADGDNRMELVITPHWAKPIMLGYEGQLWRERKEFMPKNQQVMSGFWNTVTPFDFDFDGDIDFFLGNLGQNTNFGNNGKLPLLAYYADFDMNQKKDFVLTHHDYDQHGIRKEFPYANSDDLMQLMPSIRKKFNTYEALAMAEWSSFFDAQTLKNARYGDVNEVRSGILKNEAEKGFEFVPFVQQAQVSPLYTIVPIELKAGEFWVFIHGNDLGMELLQGRADATMGLCLQYDVSTKEWTEVPPFESHIQLKGEVRSARVIEILGVKKLIVAGSAGRIHVFDIEHNF